MSFGVGGQGWTRLRAEAFIVEATQRDTRLPRQVRGSWRQLEEVRGGLRRSEEVRGGQRLLPRPVLEALVAFLGVHGVFLLVR